MSMMAAAAGAGTSTASQNAAAAALSAASTSVLVGGDITTLEDVIQIKRKYQVEANGKVVVNSGETVDKEEIEKFLFWESKYTVSNVVYIPLPEAIKKFTPDGCFFLAFTLDWYNAYVRIYYGKPPCSTPTPSDTENSEENS